MGFLLPAALFPTPLLYPAALAFENDQRVRLRKRRTDTGGRTRLGEQYPTVGIKAHNPRRAWQLELDTGQTHPHDETLGFVNGHGRQYSQVIDHETCTLGTMPERIQDFPWAPRGLAEFRVEN